MEKNICCIHWLPTGPCGAAAPLLISLFLLVKLWNVFLMSPSCPPPLLSRGQQAHSCTFPAPGTGILLCAHAVVTPSGWLHGARLQLRCWQASCTPAALCPGLLSARLSVQRPSCPLLCRLSPRGCRGSCSGAGPAQKTIR